MTKQKDESLVPCPMCKSGNTELIKLEDEHPDYNLRKVKCLNCGEVYETKETIIPGSIMPGPSLN